MMRDCNERTALNMATPTDSEGASKRRPFFLIQTIRRIQQLERYIRVCKTVNVTDGDSNET